VNCLRRGQKAIILSIWYFFFILFLFLSNLVPFFLLFSLSFLDTTMILLCHIGERTPQKHIANLGSGRRREEGALPVLLDDDLIESVKYQSRIPRALRLEEAANSDFKMNAPGN
jgi:uncharacterized SAM-binding protein YcdF (DUF218 family)